MNDYHRSGDKKDCAKMVPKLLNDEQKKCRVQVCGDILKKLENEADLLSKFVDLQVQSIHQQQNLKSKSALSPRLKKARLFKVRN